MNMMLTRPPSAMRRQSGIAMLEILGALAIGAILVMSLSAMMDTSLEDTKGQQASYYQSQIVAAGQKYIAANAATLTTSLSASGSLVAVGVTQLKAGKFLADATATRNVYQQIPCVLIRQPDSSGNPGKFDALVVTTGGDKIPEKVLAVVAANAGPSGGYISASDLNNAKGSSWSSSTTAYRSTSCTGGTNLSGNAADGGHLASNLFFDGPGQSGADFLYRNAVSGRPELNRMNTPIRFDNAALVTAGTSCADSDGQFRPAMAIDNVTNGVVVCRVATGTWSAPSQWKEPKASYAALPSTGNTVGDVRMVTDLSRAFTFNGSSWVALAVDQNDNLYVPALITADRLHTTGHIVSDRDITAGQNIMADGTITAVGDISTSRSVSAGIDVNVTRDVNATGNVNAKNVTASRNVYTQGLEVDVWASSPAISIGIHYFLPGAACHLLEYDPIENKTNIAFPMGTVVMDQNYVPLICGPDKTMRYANGTYAP